MLELQKFLKENANSWREILSSPPYSLIIKQKDTRVLFKYNQLESDFNQPIVKESRGIILEKETWNPVAVPFFKFFNIGETNATVIDWDNSKATLKIDGSIITVYWYNGWKVKTNGSIDASDATVDENGITFMELFNVAAENSSFSFDRLDPHYCYTFELVSPMNQVVIQYSETKLYHLMTRNLTTLEEEDIDIGVEKPIAFIGKSKEDYLKIVEDFDNTKEGIVVCDSNNNRIKIKTKLYFELHRIANNKKPKLEYLIDLVRENETEEFLSYFPIHKTKVEEIKIKWLELLSSCDRAKLLRPQGLSDKDYAEIAKKEKYPSLFFLEKKTGAAKEYLLTEDSLTLKRKFFKKER